MVRVNIYKVLGIIVMKVLVQNILLSTDLKLGNTDKDSFNGN